MKRIFQILIGVIVVSLYISLFTLINLKEEKKTIIYCFRKSYINCPEPAETNLRDIRTEGLYQMKEVEICDQHKHYICTYLY